MQEPLLKATPQEEVEALQGSLAEFEAPQVADHGLPDRRLNLFPGSAVLRVEGVEHGYGAQADAVLRQVRGVVHAGEALALVGESGGGKSTLLNILAGFLTPRRGEVHWTDPGTAHLRHGTDAWRAQVLAVVHQHHQLMSDFTATENVALAAQSAGIPWARALALAQEELRVLGLGHRLEALPGTLSGGERQRVGLARALVHGPRLLLADEPTASLDPKRADQVREVLLDRVRRTQLALIWVTHDPRVARQLDRQANLEAGILDFTRG